MGGPLDRGGVSVLDGPAQGRQAGGGVVEEHLRKLGKELGVPELPQVREHFRVQRTIVPVRFTLRRALRDENVSGDLTVLRGSLDDPTVKDLGELLLADRLGEVVVHARFQRLLPVALHRVGRHGDNGGGLVLAPPC